MNAQTQTNLSAAEVAKNFDLSENTINSPNYRKLIPKRFVRKGSDGKKEFLPGIIEHLEKKFNELPRRGRGT